MNKPTPLTDAAWAKTFEDHDQCRAGNAASQMRDACASLERELAALTTERDQLNEMFHQIRLKITAAGGDPYKLHDEALDGIISERDQLRAEVERRNDIINRASVQFFHDGSDGETAAKMLTVLNEAKA
jgi:hypothetical protein